MATQQQKKFNILLLGDFCIDVYQFGTIDRLSPEAPVPVFVPTTKEERHGMAGNVAHNLEALGCTVNLIRKRASRKTRLIDSRSKQHIARIDEDIPNTPIRFDTEIPNVYDAIVISDYGKGCIDYTLIKEIISEVSCPVFIDTKLTDLEQMQGAWVKINELEYSKVKSECSGLIVTQGSKGAKVPHHDISINAPAVEVVDVTGAGDTFLSALVYEFLNTNSIEKAVEFAIKASSITVQHLGVYAPTLKEIQ